MHRIALVFVIVRVYDCCDETHTGIKETIVKKTFNWGASLTTSEVQSMMIMKKAWWCEGRPDAGVSTATSCRQQKLRSGMLSLENHKTCSTVTHFLHQCYTNCSTATPPNSATSYEILGLWGQLHSHYYNILM